MPSNWMQISFQMIEQIGMKKFHFLNTYLLVKKKKMFDSLLLKRKKKIKKENIPNLTVFRYTLNNIPQNNC